MVVTNYFAKVIYGPYGWNKLILTWRKFIEWLRNEDKDKIREALEEMLEYVRNISYEWIARNPEWWLKTVIVMMLNMNLNILITEKHFVSWRPDIWIKCCWKTYLIEVKVDGNLEEIKKQLEKYRWEADVLIGINWTRKENKIEVYLI